MNWWHAGMIVLALFGIGGIVYLIADFLEFHAHHRNIARSYRRMRRWPKSQHASYFRRDFK